MPGRRAIPPKSAQFAPNTDVEDPAISRAVDQLRTGLQREQKRRDNDVITKDLVVGTNAIEHSLGREPAFVSVTPTVADASFGWALHLKNPHPDRQVLIDVVGVGQPGARIFVT